MKNTTIILILGWLFLIIGNVLFYILNTEKSQVLGMILQGISLGFFASNVLISFRKERK